ncbi:MAG TPA: YfeC-like transcriptional regulator [Coriobacteriia bacterium]|nr:YfeC-like transcriptional regulator [Coriobacteriia bacterium]
MTPQELARELGISAKTLRQWLRDQGWQSVRYSRWHLSPDQAAQARRHFAP